MMDPKPLILLTNDDGIDSPGLWAAAQELARLGTVTVVAPKEQYSGAGRSLPPHSDGVIVPRQVKINGATCMAYGVGGSPAQAVLHGLLEILPQPPALVVSGINYGENVGVGVTVSGTIGAALEAAARGVMGLAVSLETEEKEHRSYSTQVDFSTAAHFTHLFARMLLELELPFDVDVLKVEVPAQATKDTPWELTRLSRQNYYEPVRPLRTAWEQPLPVGYKRTVDPQADPEDTDVHVFCVKRHVAVTPLSLDLTSRVPFSELSRLLRMQHS
jgi:5'-nucleotidase